MTQKEISLEKQRKILITEAIIHKKMTIEQASDLFQIPKSTLYENIRSINDSYIQEELDKVFKSSKNKTFESKSR